MSERYTQATAAYILEFIMPRGEMVFDRNKIDPEKRKANDAARAKRMGRDAAGNKLPKKTNTGNKQVKANEQTGKRGIKSNVKSTKASRQKEQIKKKTSSGTKRKAKR